MINLMPCNDECLDFDIQGSMKSFIGITETLQRVVEVEADGVADAERIASDKYRQGQIVLDDTCCVDVVVRSLNPETI